MERRYSPFLHIWSKTRVFKMHVHAAVGKYAEEHGSTYAWEYARKRQTLSEDQQRVSDKTWLLRRDGLHLRKSWLSLDNMTRQELLIKNPDPDFSEQKTGILDERRLRKVKRQSRRSAQTGKCADMTQDCGHDSSTTIEAETQDVEIPTTNLTSLQTAMDAISGLDKRH